MRYLLLPFLCLAALALGVGVVVNLAAVLAHQVFLTRSTLLALFIGVFVCAVPVTLCLNLLFAHRPELRRGRRGAWALFLSGCPRWVSRLCFGLVAYAMVASLLGAASKTTLPAESPPPATRTLTLAQARNMSAGPIIFYGIMFPLMLSFFRRPELMRALESERTAIQPHA